MSYITGIKLGLAAAGILTWVYGTRVGDRNVQWLGISFLAAAVLLRFVRGKRGK